MILVLGCMRFAANRWRARHRASQHWCRRNERLGGPKSHTSALTKYAVSARAPDACSHWGVRGELRGFTHALTTESENIIDYSGKLNLNNPYCCGDWRVCLIQFIPILIVLHSFNIGIWDSFFTLQLILGTLSKKKQHILRLQMNHKQMLTRSKCNSDDHDVAEAT